MEKEATTLVDYVENKLLEYLKAEGLRPGAVVPGEIQLAEQFGVGRSVVREALSRLRMLGLVKSRTRKGMVLTEPNIVKVMHRMINPQILGMESILDLLGFRVSLEIGMADFVINNVTEENITELEILVAHQEIQNKNQLSIESDHSFHSRLYQISGNTTLMQFQEVLYPLFLFVRQNYPEYLTNYNSQLKEHEIVSHQMLLERIKAKDASGFRDLMKKHLNIYIRLIQEQHVK